MNLIYTCLVTALLFVGTPIKADPVTYFAGSHVGTEVAIQSVRLIADEWQVSIYNRVVSSLIVGVAVAASAEDWQEQQAGVLGIVTGNLLQWEW